MTEKTWKVGDKCWIVGEKGSVVECEVQYRVGNYWHLGHSNGRSCKAPRHWMFAGEQEAAIVSAKAEVEAARDVNDAQAEKVARSTRRLKLTQARVARAQERLAALKAVGS